MTIGKKIKMFRERLGLTQQALGHMVHVSENAIGNYEAGRCNPSVELLEEIKKIHPEATVVMCSSLTSEKRVFECIQKGAKHFIGKPYVEKQVIETIQNILLRNEKSSK